MDKLTLLVKFFLLSGWILTPQKTVSAESVSEPHLEVIQLTPMHFGAFSSKDGGHIRLDPRTGACTPQGVIMIRARCQRASFEVRGIPGTQVMASVAPAVFDSDALAIERLDVFPEQAVLTLAADGKATFYVGGVAKVAPGARPDGYRTAFPVEVRYLP